MASDCDDLIATIGDLEIRIERSLDTPRDIAKAKALLLDASSSVRSIAGRPFGTMEVTRTLQIRDGMLWLNELDVTAVTSVTTVTGDTLSFTWDGLHRVAVGGGFNVFDVEGSISENAIITYTRSGDTAPQWVVAMVAQMAARALGRPADETGLVQESIAGYSYSVGSATASGAIGLMQSEENRLRRAFPRAGSTAQLRVSR